MYWKLSQGPFLSVIPPPTTVTVTDRHTAHSFHTFILHTPRVETWPVYNWYQRSTTSSFRKSPRRMSFSSLIVHFCVRKKETTGPRVLILILVFIFILFGKKKHPRVVILIPVFSFLMLEFSICFALPVPVYRSGFMSFSSLIVHFCVRKKETTGPRVLILILVFIFILFEKKKDPRVVILILVFSFLMLEFSICFSLPLPVCRSGFPRPVHDCFVYGTQAGLQPLAIGASFGRSHLHGD